MRYLLAFILSVSAFFAQAQQVNPVTDYTFANRMSSGRSTVTDTAAYFSIGPRYGAVRGMMPPMVTDTTAMSANKRNGLLIFSIQKNKYQVWDSAGAKWADITGAAGSAIISADTAAMLLPYLRKADTTAMLLPYLRGSGTANYLPIFDASRSVVNSKVYQTGTNLLFNTTTASFTSAGISTIENNATSSAVYTFKTNDSLRAYIGWGGASTMDINNLRSGDIRFYTSATLRGRFQTDGTFRLNSLTGTGSRIVTADADGVLSATSSATGLVDTTVLSTRAWRQKGDDSLGAIIATKGSGTVTSVATGYGLSGGTITTTGTISADTLQLSTRAWRQKGLDSLAALEISGSGTTNYVPKFTDTRTIGNSLIYDNGSRIGIGTTSPTADLDLRGGSNQSIYLISTEGTDQNNSLESYRSSGGAWSSMLYRGLTHQFLSGPAGGPLIESARFTSSNEFLINTTTDAGDYKLQVSGNAYVTGTTVLAATSGNVQVGATLSPWTWKAVQVGTAALSSTSTVGFVSANAYFDGSYKYVSTGAAQVLEVNNGNEFRFLSAASGTAGNAISFTQAMTLTASGELLVGTTTDAGTFRLQVGGSIYNTGTYTSAAPTDGTAAPWRLGSYVTTAPTATGYVQVEINGVKYKLLAATY